MIQTRMWFTFAASSLLVMVSLAEANAQLTGSTINVSAYYPNSSSVYENPGDRIVSAATEYPEGSYPSYNPSWEVDITDNQLVINWTLSGEGTFTAADFNGFILSVISGPSISAASANPLSGFFPDSLTVESGNRVLLNYQGLFLQPNSSSIIDLSFVPEPSTFGMLGLGLTMISWCIRKR